MFRRVLKYATLIGVGSASIHVLHQNDWDVRHVGFVRFGRAALSVGRIAIDYKFSLRNANDSSPESLQKWSECHQRSADRLLNLCCVNGGVFIKVGQHIAALEYLVPTEYSNTLKVLHSRAPKSTLLQIKKVIKEDLGQNVEELFTHFEDEPIGAASLAQVHKATLKDGTTVAVKVQHPQVKRHSVVDMATMEILVNIIAKVFPEFSFLWLAEETKRNLPLELDFVHEAQNAEKLSRTYAKYDWLKIPQVDWRLTTSRVLTMEYVDGCQVTDREYMVKHGISRRDVSKKLGILYSEMIFLQGNVHCDPHPGNILIRKNPSGTEIILLDHGLYTQLTEQFRHQYSHLWMAILNKNVDEMKKWAGELGVGDLYPFLACILTAKPWTSVTRGINKRTDEATQKKERDELKKYASVYLQQIAAVLSRVDRQILLVFKTNDLLRSINFALRTSGEQQYLLTMMRYCVRSVYEEQIKLCHNWFSRLKVNVGRQWLETQINIYQIYLWLRSFIWNPENRII